MYNFDLIVFFNGGGIVFRPGNHLLVQGHGKIRCLDIQFLYQISEVLDFLNFSFFTIDGQFHEKILLKKQSAGLFKQLKNLADNEVIPEREKTGGHKKSRIPNQTRKCSVSFQMASLPFAGMIQIRFKGSSRKGLSV